MNGLSNDRAVAQLKTAFAIGGVRAAVALLNSLTDYRFTSLYRFDGPTLRNITFYDREDPAVQSCADLPVEASYCVYIRDTARHFHVEDAGQDGRVRDHPKKATVQAYCGVPLLDRDGVMFGSICHFDLKPAHAEECDIELLEYMARLLQPHW